MNANSSPAKRHTRNQLKGVRIEVVDAKKNVAAMRTQPSENVAKVAARHHMELSDFISTLSGTR